MTSKKKGSSRAPEVAIAKALTSLPAAIRTGLWAPWGYAPPPKPGAKKAKVPVSVDDWGRITWIGTNTPDAWLPFEQAQKALAKVGERKDRDGTVRWSPAGLGRLCESEPELTVLDVDGCIGKDGKLNAAAAELVGKAATYTEISPSGRGLRLALKGGKPEAIRLAEVGTIGDGTRVECYDASSTRYVTFTGNALPGTKATVAAWSKGFAKWFAENWKRSSGGAARGSVRLVSEALLAELERGYSQDIAGAGSVKFDITRFLVAKGNGAEIDRSAAFASLFARLFGDPEVGAAEAICSALATLGDNMEDKGVRRVVVVETGEVKRVPFAIADAAKIATDIEERFKVKNALSAGLPKLAAKDRAATVRQFHAEYPQHAWHVAHGALKHGVPLPTVTAIVGEETVRSVAEFMQSVQARNGRRA